MRIVTHAIVAVLAFLIGLGVGYYQWGMRAADLDRQVQQQRSDYEFRLSEQERRARAAEERARQEAEARKVLEDELHKVRPLK
ncbi:MAG: hypothetical protein ACM362_15040 [Candidatus Methylomirabilota bacterium]